MNGEWSDEPVSGWEGLAAPREVQRSRSDLARVGDRLARTLQEAPRAAPEVINAVDGVVLAINALNASADVMCTLADPPEDVDTRPRGPNGNLVTMCFHRPAHCWDGVGNRINPCP